MDVEELKDQDPFMIMIQSAHTCGVFTTAMWVWGPSTYEFVYSNALGLPILSHFPNKGTEIETPNTEKKSHSKEGAILSFNVAPVYAY